MLPAPTHPRRPALDGLRGVAALIVVVHHCLLISPTLAAGYGGSLAPPRAGSWGWWLLYTPVHVVWAGGEAVVIFFVLSGLVLALPGRSRWRTYYPQRLVRLYLPITGAVLFAELLLSAIRRTPRASSSWWFTIHGTHASLPDAVTSMAVVFGTTGLNSSLWSLQWEVVFSLLLPAFVLLFVRVRRLTGLRLAVCLAALVGSSFSSHDALHYLPMFGAGVLMAQQIGRLDGAGRGFDSLGVRPRLAVVVGAVLLLLLPWLLQSSPVFELGSRFENGAGLVACLSGAAVIVWLAGCTDVGRAAADHRALRWLGRRSFSLYLVHEPIVVTVAAALHGTTDAPLVLVIALPLSLLAAEGFGRLVEGPSHRAARRLGRSLTASGADGAAPAASAGDLFTGVTGSSPPLMGSRVGAGRPRASNGLSRPGADCA